MFTGGYIATRNNLAHEIINLFKDDKGKNYIYVQAYGTVSHNHCQKNAHGKLESDIETILLVKPSGKNVWEIIGKAEGLTPLTAIKSSWKNERKDINKEQCEYITKNGITYGNVPLNELFIENDNDENAIYYTFKAKKVLLPKCPIYITPESNKCEEDDNVYILDNIKNFAKSSLKMYVEKGKSNKLEEIINDRNKILWEKETKCFKDCNLNKINNTNFLKIIHKEDDELIFSNLFQYVFKSRPNVTQEFFKKFLHANLESNVIIEREEGDIDLLIYDKNNVIVIENKIKSGINGKKGNSSQLDKYYKYVTSEKDEYNEENKYFDKKHFFGIFIPDYNHLKIPKTKHSEEYVKIKYSQIYDFFKTYHYEYNNDQYFPQFFAALEKHTKKTDSSLQDDTYIMFANAINSWKQKH